MDLENLTKEQINGMSEEAAKDLADFLVGKVSSEELHRTPESVMIAMLSIFLSGNTKNLVSSK